MPTKPRAFTRRLVGRRMARELRATASARGYDSTWQKLRAWYLSRYPLCRHCVLNGMTTPASEVDHIVPRSRGGSNEPENLQVLCRTCNRGKSNRDDESFVPHQD